MENEWTNTIHVGENKKLISIRLDADILEFFKNNSTKYQKHINSVLRAYMEANVKKAES